MNGTFRKMDGFERIASGYRLPEAPVATVDGGVAFSDVLGGGFHRWSPTSGQVETVIPKRKGIGGAAVHADGGFVVSGRDVTHVADGGHSTILFTPDESVAGINDLTVDPEGAVIVGLLRFRPFAGEPPVPGEFVRVGADGGATVAIDGVLFVNGCGFSPDGSILYGCDYQRGVVLAADRLADGTYGPSRVAITSPSGEADGMAVDETGAVWVALGAGGTIGRFRPDGSLESELSLPTSFVASLCFGGADGRDLFVTVTDVDGAPEVGGGVFHTRVDVAGTPIALATGGARAADRTVTIDERPTMARGCPHRSNRNDCTPERSPRSAVDFGRHRRTPGSTAASATSPAPTSSPTNNSSATSPARQPVGPTSGSGCWPADMAVAHVLADQDNLYTLVHWDDRSSRARVIDVIDDFFFAPDDPERAIDAMAAPTTKIVSMTITEGAYLVDPITGAFDATAPDVAHDLGRVAGAAPVTWVGYLVEALRRRRAAAAPPFVVMSCDNVQHNGPVARAAVLAFAGRVDPDLESWIATQASFPCTMVDRITPVTTDEHRTILVETYGVADGWPVFSEPYGEWHVEAFDGARPALERVGVDVSDLATIEAHERRKIRLLNGTHQAISYLGLLLGHTYCHEAMADDDIAAFAARLMGDEIAPCVGPVPGYGSEAGFDEYAAQTRARFANSRLADTLERVGTDSWIRMTRFVLPSLLDQLRAGRPHRHLTFVVGAWLRALERHPGVLATVGGPYRGEVQSHLAAPAGTDIQRLLRIPGLLPEPVLASAASAIVDDFTEIGPDVGSARRAVRRLG